MSAALRGASPAIEIRGLSKRFGSTEAVRDLTFTVTPGRVTGFLGPNGAGKTTTLRILLDLVAATAGTATIGGVPYRQLPDPLRSVGAVLEATSFHPSRRARDHLRWISVARGLDPRRADEVLSLVGLTDAARRRVGAFSLGMRQRLQLATALLGDPRVLILDEPANGLDPQGIAWLRELVRYLAGEGRTVLVSSHLLSEVAQTVDDIVIVAEGRLRAAGPLSSLVQQVQSSMRIRTPDADRVESLLRQSQVPHRRTAPDGLVVEGATPEQLGPFLAAHQVVIYELVHQGSDLESLFLSLTAPAPPPPPGQPAAVP